MCELLSQEGSESREVSDKQRWYQNMGLTEAKEIIRENLASAARSFIAIGFYLKHIREKKLFSEDGYCSVWEFAQGEYGISTSTASRYMAINDRFSQEGNSPVVDVKYRNFGKSQLQEMLLLTDEQLEVVTPDMKVMDIREIRSDPEKEEWIDGQMCIMDFPEYLPEHAFDLDEALPPLQTFLMPVSDLPKCELSDVVAISQQPRAWNESGPDANVMEEQEPLGIVIDGEYIRVRELDMDPENELPYCKYCGQRLKK